MTATAPAFPAALTDARALRDRARDARRLRSPLSSLSPGERRRPRGASRPPTGTASSARRRSASSTTTSASTRRPSGCRASSRRRRCRWRSGSRSSCTTSACSSTTSSPSAPRPSSTRWRQDPAPPLLPQRLHLRAPAISTEHLENDEPAALPTYRAYYPTQETLAETWLRIVTNFQLARRVRGPRPRRRAAGARRSTSSSGEFRMRTNFQIQVLSSLFYRNKGAYVVGKVINGVYETPFAMPILHGPEQARLGRSTPRCSARTTSAASSASRARTSWSTWRCRRRTSQFLRVDHAAASRRPSSTRARPAEAGQERSSTATS